MFRIRQGQHSIKSPPDVGFLLCFLNVNVKFCYSETCISTSK